MAGLLPPHNVQKLRKERSGEERERGDAASISKQAVKRRREKWELGRQENFGV